MQELAAELNQKRHSKSANTMDRFSQTYVITRLFQESIGER